MTESDHSGMAEDRDDESSVHWVSDIPVHSTHYQMTLLLTAGIHAKIIIIIILKI